jgi:hypothetical protein
MNEASSINTSGLIALFCVRFLCVLMDENLAVENASGFVVQNAFVQFVAVAVRFGVVDPRAAIHQLIPGRHVKPIERRFDSLAIEIAIDFVPRQRRTE